MICKNCQESFSDELNYCPYCGFQARDLEGKEAPASYEEQVASDRLREQEALAETRMLGPLQQELREQGYLDPEPPTEVLDEETSSRRARRQAEDRVFQEEQAKERQERIQQSQEAIRKREAKRYEEAAPEKRPTGRFSRFWKPTYTAILLSVLVVFTIYLIIARVYSSSVYAFTDLLNRNMYPEAGAQFDRYLADDEEDSERARGALDNYLATLQDSYLRGDMMYAEMISALENMTATDLYQEPLNNSIDLFRQQTVNWQQTEQIYQTALTAASQNSYADAIRGFTDVLDKTGNYKDAGRQLASARASYRNYLEQEIRPFQDQGNYEEAARRLRLAADLMPDDQGIADMQQRNDLLAILALRQETKEAIAVLQLQDDFDQAFETLYAALDLAPTDPELMELNAQLRAGYAEYILRAASIMLQDGEFDDAMARIEEGLALIPGHPGLREAMLAFDADYELPDPATDRGLDYLPQDAQPTPEPTTPQEPTPEPTDPSEPSEPSDSEEPSSEDPDTEPTVTETETDDTTEEPTTEQSTAEPTASPTPVPTNTPTPEPTTQESTTIEPSPPSSEQPVDGFTGPIGSQTATDAAGEVHTNAFVYRASRATSIQDGPYEIVLPVNGQGSRLVGSVSIGGNEEIYTQTFVGIYVGGGGVADWAGSLSFKSDEPAAGQKYRQDIDFSLDGIETVWIYIETLQGEDVSTILDLEVIP